MNQQAHENMFHVNNHQGNANQKFDEVPRRTNQDGHRLYVCKQHMLERAWRKGNQPFVTAGGNAKSYDLHGRQCGGSSENCTQNCHVIQQSQS